MLHILTFMIDRLAEYNQRIIQFSDEKLLHDKKQKPLPMLRLALFLLFSVLVYRFIVSQTTFSWISAIAVLIAFVLFSIYDSKLKRKINRVHILLEINNKEIAALGGNYSGFDAGEGFVDPTHDYTHDLDIFGQGSIFQFINRTATIFGKQRLAEYFNNAFEFSSEVLPRQQAVKELSEMVDLRQRLQLIFHEEQIAVTDKTEMLEWLNSKSPVKRLKLLRILAYSLPAITFFCIAFSIVGLISFPIYLIVIQLMVVFLYGKQTLKVQSIITSKSKILSKYSQCLGLIESADFKSIYLTNLKKQVIGDDQISSSKTIHQLSVILKYMDSNLNLLVAIILNGFFMFNLHLLLKVEKWKTLNRSKVPLWFEAIATFDAMSSLGNFGYNEPDFTFPVPVTEGYNFDGEQMGHPLIPVANRVVNSMEINGWNQFFIITGANMSGKSTFLRTIGVNYILAMAGAPVCALKLSFSPIPLHSSIRTSDSLTRSESYFYAELKRLKQIIDELESGKQKFILLDEILKGTNSKDKQAGSIALIQQLLRYKSVGMFATHDLALGELAEHYPGNVNNLCFEIQIADDKMVIDYKLHDGVCKNLNATYLMKNMGILLADGK